MSETLKDEPTNVLDCGLRILKVDRGEPWEKTTRDAVSRALQDHNNGNTELSLKIELGSESWKDGESFRGWLMKTLDYEDFG